MAKIRKAVFRNGIVMLSLLAAIVLSSSVAQAQDCIARANMANTVRAEGMTEMVGGVELRCALPATTGGIEFPFDTTASTEISIQLNTPITNEA